MGEMEDSVEIFSIGSDSIRVEKESRDHFRFRKMNRFFVVVMVLFVLRTLPEGCFLSLFASTPSEPDLCLNLALGIPGASVVKSMSRTKGRKVDGWVFVVWKSRNHRLHVIG